MADSFWGLNVWALLLPILPNPTFQSAISSVKLHAFSPFFSLACSFLSFICICIERLQQFSTSMSLNHKPCRDARTPSPNISPLDSSSQQVLSAIQTFSYLFHILYLFSHLCCIIQNIHLKEHIILYSYDCSFCLYKNIFVFMYKY